MKAPRYACYSGAACPVEATLELIGGKWKGMILFHLMDGELRFGELQRKLCVITQRMLTKQLRELEDAGLVHREIYPEVPPRVEYSLTAQGQTLRPVVLALKEWGQNYGIAMAQANRHIESAAEAR